MSFFSKKSEFSGSMKMFAVYDSKVESYGTPFFLDHAGNAIRQFTSWVNNPDTPIAKYPDDFTLFEIAEYDPSSCAFNMYDSFVSHGNGVIYKTTSNPSPSN